MMFVYDLFLNFNKEMYDFYDWKETDEINHYRRIPLIKINECLYNLLLNEKILVSESFLNSIKNKTQMYKDKLIKQVEYASVFTNGYDSFAILFDKDGRINKRSSIQITDDIEINEIALRLKITGIKYSKLQNRNNKVLLLTRKEKELMSEILNKIEIIKENNEVLKYLYYEWNNELYKGNNCYEELKKTIIQKFNENNKEFLNILDLIVV